MINVKIRNIIRKYIQNFWLNGNTKELYYGKYKLGKLSILNKK
jgi:hypothetical protein